MTNIRAFSRKNKSKISYPVCKSAIKPIPHDPDLPEPQPPTEKEDTLSVDERASTGTESEEDLIESDPSFQHESAVLHHSSSIRNAWMTWCVICIYPKRKQKFWVPGYNSGIYWNQEQPFRPFVAAMKTLLVIMQVQKIYANAKI